jgi:hypothetical protein
MLSLTLVMSSFYKNITLGLLRKRSIKDNIKNSKEKCNKILIITE